MEPLCQSAGGSWPPEEPMVASVRAATKELRESVQDLCKTSLEKITALCQCFHSSRITAFFKLDYPFSVFLNNTEAKPSHVMVKVWRKVYFLLTKHKLCTVNQESVTGPTSNCAAAAAAAAAESTAAADSDGPLQTQSTGTLQGNHSGKEKDDTNSDFA